MDIVSNILCIVCNTLCKLFTAVIKTIGVIVLLSLFTSQSIAGQNNAQAKKILNTVLADIRTHTIKTRFNITTSHHHNQQTETLDGTFVLQASKFVLKMDNMQVYFDGKTQWAYVPENNEVSITEPSVKELTETNPLFVLSNYAGKSTIQFDAKKNTAKHHVILMYPTTKNDDITKIELQVNKKNKNISSITVHEKKGNTNVLSLHNVEKISHIDPKFFVFNTKNYKNLITNDLR